MLGYFREKVSSNVSEKGEDFPGVNFFPFYFADNDKRGKGSQAVRRAAKT